MSSTESLIDQLRKEIQIQSNKENRGLLSTIQSKDSTIESLKQSLDESNDKITALQILIDQQNQYSENEKLTLEQKITESEQAASKLKYQLEQKITESEQAAKELKDQLEQNNNVIVITEDPRIKNRPLPNDATVTYEYGARAYKSDIYDGFVWRNGFWYKIKIGLKFKPHSTRKIRKWNVSEYSDFDALSSKIYQSQIDTSVCINDSYIPVFLHDVRYFVRFLYSYRMNGSNTAKEVYIEGSHFYVPHMQGIIKIKVNDALMNCLIYEDENSFKEKPGTSAELDEWSRAY